MLRHWDTLDLNRTSQWGDGERVLVSADLVHRDQYCATEIKDVLISAAFSDFHNTNSGHSGLTRRRAEPQQI